MSERTIIHETLHAVGFKHSQSRHDRDLYVNLTKKNSKANADTDIDKQGQTNFGPFDYLSIESYIASNVSIKLGKRIQCYNVDFQSRTTLIFH